MNDSEPLAARVTWAVTDWAERRGSWWPAVAGLLAMLIIYAIGTGAWWAWALTALGLAMTAIRPAGTSLRGYFLVTAGRQALRAQQEADRD
jgi:hypothetical protein